MSNGRNGNDDLDDFEIVKDNNESVSLKDENNKIFFKKNRLKSSEVYLANIGFFENNEYTCKKIIPNSVGGDFAELARVYEQKGQLYIVYFPGLDSNTLMGALKLKDIIEAVDRELLADTNIDKQKLKLAKKLFTVCENNTYYGIQVNHFVQATLCDNVLTIDDSMDRNYDTRQIEKIIPNSGAIVKKRGLQSILNSWECGYYAIQATQNEVLGQPVSSKLDDSVFIKQQQLYEAGSKSYYEHKEKLHTEISNYKKKDQEKKQGAFVEGNMLNNKLTIIINHIEQIRGSTPTGIRKIKSILNSKSFDVAKDLPKMIEIAEQRKKANSKTRLKETDVFYDALIGCKKNESQKYQTDNQMLVGTQPLDALCQQAYQINHKEWQALQQLFDKIFKVVDHIKASTVFTPTGVRKIDQVLKKIKKNGANLAYLLEICQFAHERLGNKSITTRSDQTKVFYQELQKLGVTLFPNRCKNWKDVGKEIDIKLEQLGGSGLDVNQMVDVKCRNVTLFQKPKIKNVDNEFTQVFPILGAAYPVNVLQQQAFRPKENPNNRSLTIN